MRIQSIVARTVSLGQKDQLVDVWTMVVRALRY